MARPIDPAALTVLLSAVAVAGYLGYRFAAEPPHETSPATGAAAAPAPSALADRLPQFMLDNLTGEPTSISSWPGKPMLINFWATWCAPCLREIPLLKQFQADHAGVQIVGIAVDRRDPVLSFAAEMDFNYPVLVGQNDAMEAAAAFGIEVFALPITVFTDAAGAILGIHTGEVHAEHLDNLVAVLADLGEGRIDRATARARIAGTL
jgi:thiol-disulfide isomerase/thioredoxin